MWVVDSRRIDMRLCLLYLGYLNHDIIHVYFSNCGYIDGLCPWKATYVNYAWLWGLCKGHKNTLRVKWIWSWSSCCCVGLLSSWTHLCMNMIGCERFVTYDDSKVGRLVSPNESRSYSMIMIDRFSRHLLWLWT